MGFGQFIGELAQGLGAAGRGIAPAAYDVSNSISAGWRAQDQLNLDQAALTQRKDEATKAAMQRDAELGIARDRESREKLYYDALIKDRVRQTEIDAKIAETNAMREKRLTDAAMTVEPDDALRQRALRAIEDLTPTQGEMTDAEVDQFLNRRLLISGGQDQVRAIIEGRKWTTPYGPLRSGFQPRPSPSPPTSAPAGQPAGQSLLTPEMVGSYRTRSGLN